MKNKAGFTLVELLVATFMLGAVIVLVAGFATYYFQAYSFSFEQNQAVGSAQGNLTNMIREIREARSAESGAYPIVEAADNSFIFYSDVTNDGKTDRVRYFLNGTNLQRGIIEPTAPPVTYPLTDEKIKTVVEFLDNVGQPVFTYYNGEWPLDPINNPIPLVSRLLNTRFISIYLRINITPDSGAQPFELTSGVQIRSLKDNL